MHSMQQGTANVSNADFHNSSSTMLSPSGHMHSTRSPSPTASHTTGQDSVYCLSRRARDAGSLSPSPSPSPYSRNAHSASPNGRDLSGGSTFPHIGRDASANSSSRSSPGRGTRSP